jgi:L-lactate permease
MLFEAIGVATAFVLVAMKFKVTTLRRILAYHAVVDVVVTITLMALMSGTFAGMFVAMIAGGILSIALVLARKLIGYEKRVFKKCDKGHWHAQWEKEDGWRFFRRFYAST